MSASPWAELSARRDAIAVLIANAVIDGREPDPEVVIAYRWVLDDLDDALGLTREVRA